jgi:hypothetical protein
LVVSFPGCAVFLWLNLLLQGRKKLEEAFQEGKHAIDDLVNVAKVLAAVVFVLNWRIRTIVVFHGVMVYFVLSYLCFNKFPFVLCLDEVLFDYLWFTTGSAVYASC